ncbi:MAG: hypothetical protein NVS2B8_13430 [Vulcanimicrobiaceae bacterium]
MNRRLVGAGGAAVLASGIVLGVRARRRRANQSNPRAAVAYGSGQRIERHATIAREPADVYAAWRDFARLPLIMPNLVRVEPIDASRSRWTASLPGGKTVTWEAELIDDCPSERIAWRADAAPVRHAGSVRFAPAPGNRGTEVRVEIEYAPPAGLIGRIAGKFTAMPPARLVEIDLRRFKSTLESGDVALNGTDVVR